MLSQYSEPSYALALLEAGSEGRGYLLKERVHDRGAARLGGRDRGRRRLRDRPDGRRRARGREARADARRSPAHAPRAGGAGRDRPGKEQRAIAESLVLTKRAVEKHINAIFLKLGLSEAVDVSKRVKATLAFLAEQESAAPLDPR